MVNTLSLSDVDKKTAFLATLQGYPLRMMSGWRATRSLHLQSLSPSSWRCMAETTGVLKMP